MLSCAQPPRHSGVRHSRKQTTRLSFPKPNDDGLDEATHKAFAVRTCEGLEKAGIRLICIDFDLTLIGIHTGGVWQKAPEVLARSVRPCLRHLVVEALTQGLHVAIVTFSPQAKLIREVLGLAFPGVSNQIIIRALDRSWRYNGQGTNDGKIPHVASTVEEILHSRNDALAKKHCLLIDDDPKNIHSALTSGLYAVICRPANSTDSIASGLATLLNFHNNDDLL